MPAGPSLCRVAPPDLGDAGQPERLHIAADGGARGGIVLDEQAIARAARQRFEPERAGAGEQVEHARAFEVDGRRPVLQHVEQRLAHPVRGGPCGRALSAPRWPAPLNLPGDDAHFRRVACRRAVRGAGRVPRPVSCRAGRPAPCASPPRPRRRRARRGQTARTTRGSAGSRSAPDARRCASPRGSCLRARRSSATHCCLARARCAPRPARSGRRRW